MSIKIYKSTDQDAPQLTGTAGSLITLLDACLVNGYGSNPSAGWTKEYSDTNKAAYRMSTTAPGSTGMYLFVDDTKSFSGVRGYESMSGINNGTNPFPADFQIPYALCFIKSQTTDAIVRPWVLVATERSFYLFSRGQATTLGGSTFSASDGFLFFGDIASKITADQYCCGISATNISFLNYSSPPSGNVSFGRTGSYGMNQNGFYLARSWDSYSKSVSGGICPYSPYYSESVLGPQRADAYPDKVTGGLTLFPVFYQESSLIIRGQVPGFFVPHGGSQVPVNFFDTVTSTLNGQTDIYMAVPVYNGASYFGLCLIKISDSWY